MSYAPILFAHHPNREFKIGSLPGRPRFHSAKVVCGWLIALFMLAVFRAPAQEALRESQAGDAAAQARIVQSESLPYTIKSGDFKLLVVPSLGLDWNDNINISKTNALQDFILKPQVQLNASYPVSQNNLLSLNVGAGYQNYFEHPSYSTWYLASDSGLSFDIYVKDFWINLHDRANYVQDTSQNAALSGTGTYAIINNTADLKGHLGI